MASKENELWQARIFREVRPHFHLFFIAQQNAYLSNRGPESSEDESDATEMYALTANVFSAFTIEAYLNFLGGELFDSWKSLERQLTPRAKLDLICETLDFAPNFGKRPWQSFTPLMSFRNRIAHAKLEKNLQYEENLPDYQDRLSFPKASWEEECDPKIVDRYLSDMEQIIEQLHANADLPGEPFGHGGMSSKEYYQMGEEPSEELPPREPPKSTWDKSSNN